MIIAIDTGNKQIKSAHKVFVSGLLESDTLPPLGNDVILYKDKYYSLSGQRIPYLRDKTVNDKFFILTLFAIAYEIEARNRYSANDIVGIKLTVGLPPAHFGSQYERFEQYFAKYKDVIMFEFNNRSFHISFTDVMCFPQAYAAAIPVIEQVKDYPHAIVIDLGGYTLDYLRLSHGQADLSVCDSLENGVIHMYNDIKSKVNADCDLLLEESDIDAIIANKHTDYPKTVIQIVEKQTWDFVNNTIGKLRERMIALRNGKTIFVGGGSILLRKYIEASDKVSNSIFVDDVTANVTGYEILYRACINGEKR